MHDWKILIIDDDEQDRKGMEVVLTRDGYTQLFFAETAQEGIQKTISINPDITIVDVVLKNIDGFDVCSQVRQQGINTKIIMITGHLDAVNAQKARASGANEIVEKSPGFTSLPKAMKELLES